MKYEQQGSTHAPFTILISFVLAGTYKESKKKDERATWNPSALQRTRASSKHRVSQRWYWKWRFVCLPTWHISPSSIVDRQSQSRTTGSIEVNDAKLALQSLGVTIQKEDIHSFLSPAEDSLDLHLFSQIATIKLEQKQTSETAFALFDQNGKGVICLEDLQRICKELEEDFTNDDLQEMVDEADRSGEGFVSKLDFYRIIRMLNLWIASKKMNHTNLFPGYPILPQEWTFPFKKRLRQ